MQVQTVHQECNNEVNREGDQVDVRKAVPCCRMTVGGGGPEEQISTRDCSSFSRLGLQRFAHYCSQWSSLIWIPYELRAI